MGLLLSIIAGLALYLLAPILILFAVIRRAFSFWALKKIDRYFYNIALSIDQLGNVVGCDFLNATLLLHYDGVLFGNADQTISYVIACNQKIGNLTRFGKFWAWFLDFVDHDHLKKALNNSETN